MNLNFDYLLSSTISVVMHGALAAGIYGAVTSGPSINFQSGNGGIEVSIVAPSEILNKSSSSLAALAPIPLQHQIPLPSPQAEIHLKPVENRRWTETPKTVSASAIRPVSLTEATNRATNPEQTTKNATHPCEDSPECSAHSSLGHSGENVASSISVLRAPKPPYPWAARRAGFEGQVEVAVEITKEGEVRAAELSKSSGREDCDRSAVETIRERWRFEPARRFGSPIDWHENIIVVYNLKN